MKCVDGYNASLFAYGQSQTGKTFTLLGDHQNNGVVTLAVKDLLSIK